AFPGPALAFFLCLATGGKWRLLRDILFAQPPCSPETIAYPSGFAFNRQVGHRSPTAPAPERGGSNSLQCAAEDGLPFRDLPDGPGNDHYGARHVTGSGRTLSSFGQPVRRQAVHADAPFLHCLGISCIRLCSCLRSHCKRILE